MNRLDRDARTQTLAALCGGASVNVTSRQTGVSKATILMPIADSGPICEQFQCETLVNLSCQRIQCGETWSFVHCWECNVPRDEKGRGRGDCWIRTAIDADTKLAPCWHFGVRDACAASCFMKDLASRPATRIHLTTDGHRAYRSTVEEAFGWNGVDYATLVKLYGPTPEGATRYSPPVLIDLE